MPGQAVKEKEEEGGGREAEEARGVPRPPPAAGGAGVRGPRVGDLWRRLQVRESRMREISIVFDACRSDDRADVPVHINRWLCETESLAN